MSEKVTSGADLGDRGGTLALLKLGIGIFAGSLALVSEGIHSSLDFLVTLATWLSVKSGGRAGGSGASLRPWQKLRI